MKKIQFIKESLKSLKEVGTIFPSSKFVVEKMVEPINFEKNLTILELGSGINSTPHFLNKKIFPNTQEVISYEDDLNWYKKIS